MGAPSAPANEAAHCCSCSVFDAGPEPLKQPTLLPKAPANAPAHAPAVAAALPPVPCSPFDSVGGRIALGLGAASGPGWFITLALGAVRDPQWQQFLQLLLLFWCAPRRGS